MSFFDRRERSRKLEALLEEERRQQGPPALVRDSVGERVEATLGAEISIARLLEHQIGRPSHPRLRLVRNVTRPAVASLLAYAPMALASLGAVGLASGVAYVNLPHQIKEPVRRALRLPSDDHPSVPLDPFGLRPVEAPLDPSTPIPPPVPVGSHRSVAPAGSPGAEAVRGSAIKRRTSKVASRAGSPGPVVSAHDLSLGEESALLEQARADLLRGSGVRALQALATHERRFPEGRMSEQREALTIQALAQTGRRDEAYWRAKRFRERFPGSLMLEVIRSALEGEEP